jgi:hypothetical protein
MKKNLSIIIAAAIVASLSMLPADARPKKQKRPDPQRRHEVQTQTPSLDGRITGRTRTCWFETLQSTDWGFPTDPTLIDARRKRIGGDNLATGVP